MHDLQFRLLGFMVTIQPFFWLLAGLLGASHLGQIEDNMPFWLAKLAVFMLAVLISILVHELGHALAFRHLYGVSSMITVHCFGGETVPLRQIYRSYTFAGSAGYMFLSFSGPLAGFILAFLFLEIYQFLPPAEHLPAILMSGFIFWTAYISIIWGIFNLLPIYPMDGGHIAREFLDYLFPRTGRRYSLILSMGLAVFLAVLALRIQSFFIVFLFAYFAYMNYQELNS